MAIKFARSVLAAAVGGAMLAALAQPAYGLEFSKHSSNSADVNAILAKGKIDDGDTYELKLYIASLPKKPNTVVYLDSPGGVLIEGLRLGRFFYEAKIETVVAAKTMCASACALAFLGGRDNATGKSKRTKATNGRLGFHSFSREFDTDRKYSADDLKYVVQKTQTEVYGIAEYLRDIKADPDVLRIMLHARADEMNFVSNDDAVTLGILIFDEKRTSVIQPELVTRELNRRPAGEVPTPALGPQVMRLQSAG